MGYDDTNREGFALRDLLILFVPVLPSSFVSTRLLLPKGEKCGVAIFDLKVRSVAMQSLT